MEKSTLEILPANEQIVNIKIEYLSYGFVTAQYFQENQIFVVQDSGLRVSASAVNYWEEI